MELQIALTHAIRQAIQQIEDGPAHDVLLSTRPLHGGMEANSVASVLVRYRTPSNRRKTLRLVAKQLTGRPTREGMIYEQLLAAHARDLAPRLIAVERTGPSAVLLLIEAVRRANAWPWRSVAASQALLSDLAAFHLGAENERDLVPQWDYETELCSIAEQTYAALDACRNDAELSDLAKNRPYLSRIVGALPALRAQLLGERPFGCRPIHGDLHPGNVLMRRRSGRQKPILLDWGRTRVASPLEDVSSWLQSVYFWEPLGRGHHDMLLTSYLSAIGMDRRVTSSVRSVYWMAAASNVLSGALLHHLRMASRGDRTPPERSAAHLAARDALRIIRRADTWWSSPVINGVTGVECGRQGDAAAATADLP